MEQAIDLLNQIIEMEAEEDRRWKSMQIARNKASQASGESKVLFHLKVLKELLLDTATKESLS